MRYLLSLYISICFTACSGQTDSLQKPGAVDFNNQLSNAQVQLLDVRTEAEFKSGHIKNAMWANWNDSKQFQERVKYIDKDKPVFVYCLAGGRSAAAAHWLLKNGYKNIVELDGGINAWKKANLPLDGASKEKQLTLAEYEASIPADKTVLVDVGAAWCPPCKKMQPIIDELKADNSISFLLINIDAGLHTELLKSLNIDPIPVFLVYKNGKMVWRKDGIVSKEELVSQLH
jgi:rhodanese-related sulfurtransferase